MLARIASRAMRMPVLSMGQKMMVPQRAMAMGPAASATTVSDELLEKLSTLSTQSLIDGLWVMGWPDAFIEGARGLKPGQKCAGASDARGPGPSAGVNGIVPQALGGGGSGP